MPKQHRRWRLVAAGLTAAAALLIPTACASNGSTSSGPVDLTVYQITTADSSPLYLGIEKGFFSDEGLNVTVKIAQSGSAIIPSVVSGESPIGYANVVSDLAAIDQGLDIKFVSNCCGVGDDAEKDTSEIFVLPDSSIETAADLAGKKIAVNSTKNLGDLTIPIALKKLGVDPSGIQYVPMNYSDMAAALERGDVDAIWGVEPFRTQDINAGYRAVLANFTAAIPNSTLGYYITSGDYANEHPDVVAAFQRALDKSNEYATEHEDELRQTAIDKVGVDSSIAAVMNFAKFTPGLDEDSVKTYAQAAVEYGIISAEPDYSNVFVTPQTSTSTSASSSSSE